MTLTCSMPAYLHQAMLLEKPHMPAVPLQDAYSSAHGVGLRSASPQQRRPPQVQPGKRRRVEATSPAKSNQTDAMDSLDSTAAPSLTRHTPPRSGTQPDHA